MSFIYQNIPMSILSCKTNKGLKSILIDIGKIEYQIMNERAIRNGRKSFMFPSGHFPTKDKIRCLVNENNPVTDKMFYKQGKYRINKNTGMDQNNATAIRYLVHSSVEYQSDGDGIKNMHNVFKLHRIKAPRIFASVYQYLVNRSISQYLNQGLNAYDVMLHAKRKAFGKDGLPLRTGAEIVATPYYSKIIRKDCIFVGKKEVVAQIQAFNGINEGRGI